MTEVKFSDNSWFKRYLDEKRWHDIREEQAISELKKCFTYDIDRIIYNIKEGGMSYCTKYAEYIFSKDSVYQSELPS